eukprot:scaffold93465_cov30-Tisochrysis_lutea.AAC.4
MCGRVGHHGRLNLRSRRWTWAIRTDLCLSCWGLWHSISDRRFVGNGPPQDDGRLSLQLAPAIDLELLEHALPLPVRCESPMNAKVRLGMGADKGQGSQRAQLLHYRRWVLGVQLNVKAGLGADGRKWQTRSERGGASVVERNGTQHTVATPNMAMLKSRINRPMAASLCTCSTAQCQKLTNCLSATSATPKARMRGGKGSTVERKPRKNAMHAARTSSNMSSHRAPVWVSVPLARPASSAGPST